MPAVPKPPPRIRKRKRPSPLGKEAELWRSFRHNVAYPLLWAKWYQGYDEGSNKIAGVECRACKKVLDITLLPRPNERGEWWHVENLALHHEDERDTDPDKKYDMKNIRVYCHDCHAAEHRRRGK